jgi:mRNA interferase MazF
MASPKRGEIYWVDFDPVKGREQGGRRPALIIQNDLGNEHSDYTVVVAITSRIPGRAYPFVVILDEGEGGLPKPSAANCSQIRTIDQSRLITRIGSLSEDRMSEVAAALRYELMLDE